METAPLYISPRDIFLRWEVSYAVRPRTLLTQNRPVTLLDFSPQLPEHASSPLKEETMSFHSILTFSNVIIAILVNTCPDPGSTSVMVNKAFNLCYQRDHFLSYRSAACMGNG